MMENNLLRAKLFLLFQGLGISINLTKVPNYDRSKRRGFGEALMIRGYDLEITRSYKKLAKNAG